MSAEPQTVFQRTEHATFSTERSAPTFQERRLKLLVPRPTVFAAYGAVATIGILALAGMVLLADGRVSDGLHFLLRRMFWVSAERNVPTAFAFLLVIVACLLVAVVAWQQLSARLKWRWHWAALSGVLLYIAFDEAARLHEHFNELMTMTGIVPDSGIFYYPWVVVGVAFVLVVGAAFQGFILALPSRVRLLVIAAGAIFVTGALGMEMVFGVMVSTNDPLVPAPIVVMLEEGFEMIGMLVFSVAVVTLLRQDADGTREYMAGDQPA